MKVRYTLTPQMREYDKIGIVWLPYLMYFYPSYYKSSVLNTDSRGFRITYKGSKKISDFKNINAPVCLFVGNSTAFGVGATNDRNTIPSILNSNSEDIWLNFGGGAFSSTQEFLLFLFNYHHIENIKKIIIFSGINNLVLYYLSKEYSKELGSFFFWNQYNQAMNRTQLSIKRKILKTVFKFIYKEKIDYSRITKKELFEYILCKKSKNNLNARIVSSMNRNIGANYKSKDDLLYVLQRDVRNWKLVSDAFGIKLHYVLQPLANWTRKKNSKEEKMLFSELDNHPGNQWKILKNYLDYNQYIWFSKHIKEICNSCGVSFFNMNEGLSTKHNDGKWLFVDRAHLTDEGNQIIAEILKEQVIYK